MGMLIRWEKSMIQKRSSENIQYDEIDLEFCVVFIACLRISWQGPRTQQCAGVECETAALLAAV
jgi:hypothetical protein